MPFYSDIRQCVLPLDGANILCRGGEVGRTDRRGREGGEAGWGKRKVCMGNQWEENAQAAPPLN